MRVGWIVRESARCFAIYVDAERIDTADSRESAEEKLLQIYLFQRGYLEPEGGEQ